MPPLAIASNACASAYGGEGFCTTHPLSLPDLDGAP
jgi:hypothetical protein